MSCAPLPHHVLPPRLGLLRSLHPVINPCNLILAPLFLTPLPKSGNDVNGQVQTTITIQLMIARILLAAIDTVEVVSVDIIPMMKREVRRQRDRMKLLYYLIGLIERGEKNLKRAGTHLLMRLVDYWVGNYHWRRSLRKSLVAIDNESDGERDGDKGRPRRR